MLWPVFSCWASLAVSVYEKRGTYGAQLVLFEPPFKILLTFKILFIQQSSIIVKILHLNKMIAQTWTFFFNYKLQSYRQKTLDKYMYGFWGVLFTFGTVPISNNVIICFYLYHIIKHRLTILSTLQSVKL